MVLVSFQLETLPAVPLLYALHIAIYQDHAGLASAFWEFEFPHPARRSLLELAASHFPMHLDPLLNVLTSLATDSDSAARVVSFLDHMTIWCTPWDDKLLQSCEIDANGNVEMMKDLMIDGVTFPAHTLGQLLPSTPLCPTAIVQWRITYSGYVH
jgi:hypothetical protein